MTPEERDVYVESHFLAFGACIAGLLAFTPAAAGDARKLLVSLKDPIKSKAMTSGLSPGTREKAIEILESLLNPA